MSSCHLNTIYRFLIFAILPFVWTAKTGEGTVKVPRELFFDTKILSNPSATKKLLLQEGFIEGFFKTPDNLRINYLFLERPHARFNVILCAGWLPGRKEGLATFYTLFGNSCNMLLFDARGHGSSEGKLLSAIWEYGVHEYKDVLGALSFMRSKNSLPTIVFGMCAGAFHAAHAVIHLQTNGLLGQFNLKGLVFDSGWASVDTASRHAPLASIQEQVQVFLGTILRRKKNDPVLLRMPLTRALRGLIKHTYNLAHATCFEPWSRKHAKRTNLLSKVHLVPLPVFFIHAHDDHYVPIKDAIELAEKAPQSVCWWITNPSKHACHHLKYSDEYQKRLHHFINQVLL